MSAIYENLSPNGHESMIVRIFTKIKNWVETVFQLKSEELTYAQYQNLTPAQIMDGKIRCITDYPTTANIVYDSTTGYIIAKEGVATYDTQTGYIIIGG